MSAELKVSRLIVEENHDLPLVRAHVALRTGAGDDPAAEDGLANFATELMARGAGGRTRARLDAAFDALGATLEVVTDSDSTSFEVTVLREKLDEALALIADVLLRPDFPADEADKLRRELKAQLDELRDDDGQLARRFFTRALYGEHPYGRSVIGSEATLDRVTVETARAWHAGALHAGNLVVGFAGDLARDAAERACLRSFGEIPSGAAHNTARPDPPPVRGLRVTLVDKPDRTQSQILFGQPAPKWGTPDYTALKVATCAFGGTFTARLMNEVRSKRGLSYGASARLGGGRGRRALVMHVFPSLTQTAETLELVLRLYREWVEGGITEDELAFAKGYLSRSFAFSLATPEDRLDLRATLELAGLPADYADSYVERIRAVTLDETRRAQAAHLTSGDLEICVVASAEELLPLLDKAGLTARLSIETVPFDSY